MSEVLIGWLEIQALGLIVWPLAFRWLRRLPDRGYMLSKPLGLLLATYGVWLLASLHILPNSPTTLLVVVAILIVISLFVYRRAPIDPLGLRGWLRDHWRLILAYEIVFAVALIGWALFRAHMPDAFSSEKPMDLAFFNAIRRSAWFPPYDPWFAGSTIPYYYFGYVMMVVLNHLPQFSAGTVHSLTNALWFALTAAGAFGLVANLILLTSHRIKSVVVFGGLAAVMVTLMGNLEAPLEVARQADVGSQPFWTWLDVPGLKKPLKPDRPAWPPRNDDRWWLQASRVIHDYAPTSLDAQRAALLGRAPDEKPLSQEFINEFPQFIFVLGDDHAHVLALPFVLLVMSLTLQIYLTVLSADSFWLTARVPAGRPAARTRLVSIGHYGLYALAIGALLVTNSWDYPIYLALMIGALVLGQWQSRQVTWRRTLISTVILIAVSWLWFLPYHLNAPSPGLLPWPNIFNATRVPQFFLVFGIFVIIGGLFGWKLLIDQVRARQQQWRSFTLKSLGGGLLIVSGAVIIATLIGASVWNYSASVRAWFNDLLAQLAARNLAVGDFLLVRLLNPWVLLGAAISLAALILLARARRSSRLDPTLWVIGLFALGLLLTLVVETIYAVGVLDKTRLNTGFKLYFQVWVMWSIAAAYGLFYMLDSSAKVNKRGKRIAISIVAAGTIGLGMIYPLLAIRDRIDPAMEPTLDIVAAASQSVKLRETVLDATDEYQAAQWLNANVSGSPVLLEATSDDPRFPVGLSLMSSWTGLPTLLGWPDHEAQWRGNSDSVRQRLDDVTTIYTTPDEAAARALLDRYRVVYIYVGDYERELYPADGLAKFEAMFSAVFRSDNVAIYQVR